MFHEAHFPNPCTLWTQNAFPKSQSLESNSLLLCSCLLGPLLSASKESLLIVQIDSQLCLIYCWVIYWAAALPVPLRCWLTGRELPRACTRHSLAEREMLWAYKEAFSAQQLETTDCLIGETLWHLLIPSNSLKRDLPQINLWNGNAHTYSGRRTAAHPAHANSKNSKKKRGWNMLKVLLKYLQC